MAVGESSSACSALGERGSPQSPRWWYSPHPRGSTLQYPSPLLSHKLGSVVHGRRQWFGIKDGNVREMGEGKGLRPMCKEFPICVYVTVSLGYLK